ncbi:hypothetical protein CAEBREN_13349 [Caenorhabditis brenneri]|uniref:Ubiquitin-like domain-containing protein n=1 Tax=Caenorhabditis brenneri TaxID=135651 RepID=G0NDA9_CAEBE|nr:hypothetical protein CAEBREN_13349 [Caenorhabditis brenneri]
MPEKVKFIAATTEFTFKLNKEQTIADVKKMFESASKGLYPAKHLEFVLKNKILNDTTKVADVDFECSYVLVRCNEYNAAETTAPVKEELPVFDLHSDTPPLEQIRDLVRQDPNNLALVCERLRGPKPSFVEYIENHRESFLEVLNNL